MKKNNEENRNKKASKLLKKQKKVLKNNNINKTKEGKKSIVIVDKDKAKSIKEKRKIFLQVGNSGYSFIKKQKKYFLEKFNIIFYNLVDENVKKDKELVKKLEEVYEKIIFCDLSNTIDIFKAIKDIQKDVIGLSTSADYNIKYLRKVIPFFPNLKNPTSTSLKWASDKSWMRQFWNAYDPNISPNFIKVESDDEEQIKKIEEKLEYPIMLKPTNMASSKLITKNYHRDELEKSLKDIFKKGNIVQRLRDTILKKNYTDNNFDVIAEEFMEGVMYSADGVVDNKGKVFIYPPVYVKTGKEIGFDDFFGYMQILPSKVSEKNRQKMNLVIEKGIDALQLRNTHFHIELFRTEDHGWRIIEIAPRIGGFRDFLYRKVYGFSVNRNNILNKLGKKINIKEEVKNTAAVLKIYAKEEGKIKKILGLKKIKELDSFLMMKQKKKAGDIAKFAKNGDDPVFIFYLKNKERGVLLGDARKIEKELKIII